MTRLQANKLFAKHLIFSILLLLLALSISTELVQSGTVRHPILGGVFGILPGIATFYIVATYAWWMRHADEYQRLLEYKAIAVATAILLIFSVMAGAIQWAFIGSSYEYEPMNGFYYFIVFSFTHCVLRYHILRDFYSSEHISTNEE